MQQLVQIDLKGWGANYLPSCHHHSVIQILNSVAGKLCQQFFLFVFCTWVVMPFDQYLLVLDY